MCLYIYFTLLSLHCSFPPFCLSSLSIPSVSLVRPSDPHPCSVIGYSKPYRTFSGFCPQGIFVCRRSSLSTSTRASIEKKPCFTSRSSVLAVVFSLAAHSRNASIAHLLNNNKIPACTEHPKTRLLAPLRNSN